VDERRNQYQYRTGKSKSNASSGVRDSKYQSTFKTDKKFDAKSVQAALEKHHMPYLPPHDTSSSKHSTNLEISLADHTEVDNMDEENKFICNECSTKGTMCLCMLLRNVTYTVS